MAVAFILSMAERIYQIINEIPERQLTHLLEYAVFIKQKSQLSDFSDLAVASQSSTGFWDNPVDDEVWNNV